MNEANFADANVKGCFFHFCFNVWKHGQNIGLQLRCVEEPEFSLQLHMLNAYHFFHLKILFRDLQKFFDDISRNFDDIAKELLVHPRTFVIMSS